MFFLTGKEGLVLKTDCGPILLYVSEEEKKHCSIALAGRSKTRL